MRKILFTTAESVAAAKRRLNPSEKRNFVKGYLSAKGVVIMLDEPAKTAARKSYKRRPAAKRYGRRY